MGTYSILSKYLNKIGLLVILCKVKEKVKHNDNNDDY